MFADPTLPRRIRDLEERMRLLESQSQFQFEPPLHTNFHAGLPLSVSLDQDFLDDPPTEMTTLTVTDPCTGQRKCFQIPSAWALPQGSCCGEASSGSSGSGGGASCCGDVAAVQVVLDGIAGGDCNCDERTATLYPRPIGGGLYDHCWFTATYEWCGESWTLDFTINPISGEKNLVITKGGYSSLIIRIYSTTDSWDCATPLVLDKIYDAVPEGICAGGAATVTIEKAASEGDYTSDASFEITTAGSYLFQVWAQGGSSAAGGAGATAGSGGGGYSEVTLDLEEGDTVIIQGNGSYNSAAGVVVYVNAVPVAFAEHGGSGDGSGPGLGGSAANGLGDVTYSGGDGGNPGGLAGGGGGGAGGPSGNGSNGASASGGGFPGSGGAGGGTGSGAGGLGGAPGSEGWPGNNYGGGTGGNGDGSSATTAGGAWRVLLTW